MASAEHDRRRLLERNMRNSYFPRGNAGLSKADLMRELAEAVRNTAAQATPEIEQ